MRKIAIALSTLAFALGSAAIPAVAAKKEAPLSTAEAQPKKVMVKKAKPKSVAKYQRKCKAGEVWNASATASAGACVKQRAKVKVKPAAKSAAKPAKPSAKKVG